MLSENSLYIIVIYVVITVNYCKCVIVTFNKTLFDTKHIQINIYINLINCTQT